MLPLAAVAQCQSVLPPTSEWVFGTTDEARGYLRAERFQAEGPVYSIQLGLLQMAHDPDLWQPCLEFPQQVHVQIFADNEGWPGALLLDEYQNLPVLQPGPTYGDVAPLALLTIELDPALGLRAGWLAVAGRGDPDCLLLWGSASGGDGISCLDRGEGWELVDYDLNFCLGWQPLAPPLLSLVMTASGAMLSWTEVVGATGYQVWRSLDGWSYQALGAPQTSTFLLDSDANQLEKANYRVRAILP
ncbi:MAG: hypothetical protein Q8O14_04525 [bacterium]|jgi:hypothetical protein|nr:hypothetical protein [bacterium]